MRSKLKDTVKNSRSLRDLLVLCGAVAFYMLLNHLSVVSDALRFVFGVLSPVFSGAILSYFLYPIVRFFKRRLFRKWKKGGHVCAVILTLVLFLALVALLLLMVIPQLAESVKLLISNIQGYADSLSGLVDRLSKKYLGDSAALLDANALRLENLDWRMLAEKVVEWLSSHANGIIGGAFGAGRSVLNTFITFMFTVYMLLDVDHLTKSLQKLFRAILTTEHYASLARVCRLSDKIMMKYFGGNLLDSLIIGVMCYIFMLITHLPYALLITAVVAITNFIPTFGPIIGGAFGAFLILLVNPMGALWFLIYTLLSQACDANLIKPLLFGDSTGLRPMWVLAAIIVGGGLFGMAGMLLGVPVAGIIGHLLSRRIEDRLEEKGYTE